MATIKEIKEEIAEYTALLKDSSVPADEKKFAKEEIADLEKQLKALEAKPEKKAKKEPKAKKEKKKTVNKVTTYQYKGKNIKDLSESECAEMKKEVEERRKKATESGKKSKSKPVIEKIAGNVATAVKQVIKSVPLEEIKEDPKKEINKFERIEKAAKSFISEMRSILGEEYDKETVQDEFKEIHKLIQELSKKYSK